MTTPTLALTAAIACGAGSLSASISYISQPTATYLGDTTLLPVVDPEGSIISSESNSTVTISFLSGGVSTLMDVDAVPDSWATWGSPPDTESSTPSVLDSDDSLTDIVFQFSLPLTTFGMELEPNDFGIHTITATFMLAGNPVGSLALPVSGNGGALLFAATGAVFDSVEVSSDIDVGVAEFRYVVDSSSSVPEPAAGLLALLGLLSLVRFRRVRAGAHHAMSSAK